MERLSSEITGRVLAGANPANSIGRERGRTDASKSLTVNDDSARAWLLSQGTPKQVDEAMCRSLISSFGVMVRLRTETRFPPEGGYYEIVTGCDLIWQDGAEPEKAAEFLKGCLAGPTREQAEGWLAILQAACAPRRGSEATASVTLALYASTLMEYPADIAKTVCLHLARGNGPGTNWFPTLGEVVDAADKLARTRRVMVNESHFVRRGTPPAAIAQEAGPSESDRLEVKRMVEALKAELKPTPAKPYLFPQGKVDASGITSRLRALVEARRAP